MKNKKGFTLIELLAVIVILAIIALIAVPIILNMINNARKSAAKSSALGYIDSIEAYAGFNQISDDAELTGYDVNLPTMTNGQVICTKTSSGWNTECRNFFEAVDKKAKGQKPVTATIVIDANGKVLENSVLEYNGYEVNYDGEEAYIGNKTSNNSSGNNNSGNNNSGNNNSGNNSGSNSSTSFGGTIDTSKQYSSAHVEQLGLKGVAYFNPKNLSESCDKAHAISTLGTKEGCMKFYIYDDSGSNYKMILDHNTTGTLTYFKTSYGANEDTRLAPSVLSADTTGWVGTTDFITADEIASITGTPTYNGSSSSWFYFAGTGDDYHTPVADSLGESPYSWLFEHTNRCEEYGCDTTSLDDTGGYWTSTIATNDSIRVWVVDSRADCFTHRGIDDNTYGIRPVIILPKSTFNS